MKVHTRVECEGCHRTFDDESEVPKHQSKFAETGLGRQEPVTEARCVELAAIAAEAQRVRDEKERAKMKAYEDNRLAKIAYKAEFLAKDPAFAALVKVAKDVADGGDAYAAYMYAFDGITSDLQLTSCDCEGDWANDIDAEEVVRSAMKILNGRAP